MEKFYFKIQLIFKQIKPVWYFLNYNSIIFTFKSGEFLLEISPEKFNKTVYQGAYFAAHLYNNIVILWRKFYRNMIRIAIKKGMVAVNFEIWLE